MKNLIRSSIVGIHMCRREIKYRKKTNKNRKEKKYLKMSKDETMNVVLVFLLW